MWLYALQEKPNRKKCEIFTNIKLSIDALPGSLDTQAYRRQIVVGCLTDKCPSCHTAVTDQTACDAVVCANPACGADFCGICFSRTCPSSSIFYCLTTSSSHANHNTSRLCSMDC